MVYAVVITPVVLTVLVYQMAEQLKMNVVYVMVMVLMLRVGMERWYVMQQTVKISPAAQ